MSISSLQLQSQNDPWIKKISQFPAHRITITESETKWRDEAMQRLQGLIRLEHGWDGYAAIPVTLATATFTLKMLEVMCSDDTVAPQIIPGPNGEVQLEWHTHTGDVEILVRAPNDVFAWRHLVGNDGDGEEMQLSQDFLQAVRWIKDVMEPKFAYAAAA